VIVCQQAWIAAVVCKFVVGGIVTIAVRTKEYSGRSFGNFGKWGVESEGEIEFGKPFGIFVFAS
jgi:hypothetical protein